MVVRAENGRWRRHQEWNEMDQEREMKKKKMKKVPSIDDKVSGKP